MGTLCLGCMRPKEQEYICEHCGFDSRTDNLPHQLPIGTILMNQYLVGKVLGQGGFGITYLGWDQNLAVPVAIKEYFPSGVVHRHAKLGTGVFPINGDTPELFEKHKERFLKEARALAKLSDISEIVQIRNFFSENGTAYIVMEYVQGITLKTHLKNLGRPMTETEALAVMEPVLLGLQKVHDLGLIHRDISPDNIMLPLSGGIKLIDFGTVRYTDASGKSKSTEAVLKPGFAPSEQYNTHGHLGPWTDVYAVSATFHYLLTGRVPPEVMERLDGREKLDLLRSRADLSRKFIEVLEKGMKIIPSDRIQSVQQMHRMLYAAATPKVSSKTKKEAKPQKTNLAPQKARTGSARWLAALPAAALILAAILTISSGYNPFPQNTKNDSLSSNTGISDAEQTYQAALIQYQEGNYQEARAKFQELGDYRNSAQMAETCQQAISYLEAEELARAGKHERAGIAFAKLGQYQDAPEKSLEQWNISRKRKTVASGFEIQYQTVILGISNDGTVLGSGSNAYGQRNVQDWENVIDLYTNGMVSYGLCADGTVRSTQLYDAPYSTVAYRKKPGICSVQVREWTNIAAMVPYSTDMIGICYDGTIVKTQTDDSLDFDVRSWNNVANMYAVELDSTYYPLGLLTDGTVRYEGAHYRFPEDQWYDITRIDVGYFGVVGFRSDGKVLVAEPPEEDTGSSKFLYGNDNRKFLMENWEGVVDISGRYRLKSDGTVDAPPEYMGDVKDWTDIQSIYSTRYNVYGIRKDNTVVSGGKEGNGALNTQDWTDIVEVIPIWYYQQPIYGSITIGLKPDGSLVIAEHITFDAKDWKNIRIPE